MPISEKQFEELKGQPKSKGKNPNSLTQRTINAVEQYRTATRQIPSVADVIEFIKTHKLLTEAELKDGIGANKLKAETAVKNTLSALTYDVTRTSRSGMKMEAAVAKLIAKYNDQGIPFYSVNPAWVGGEKKVVVGKTK